MPDAAHFALNRQEYFGDLNFRYDNGIVILSPLNTSGSLPFKSLVNIILSKDRSGLPGIGVKSDFGTFGTGNVSLNKVDVFDFPQQVE